METARLLSTVLAVAADHAAGIPRDASPSALAAAVERLTEQGLLQHSEVDAVVQPTGDGWRLLDRIGRCQGGARDAVWWWDGRDF